MFTYLLYRSDTSFVGRGKKNDYQRFETSSKHKKLLCLKKKKNEIS